MACREITKMFHADEDGAITSLGLGLFLTSLIVLGISLDVARLYSASTQLQVNADAAAHAAIYYRDTHAPDDARAAAVSVVSYGMPDAIFGEPVKTTDIYFGTFDNSNDTFTVDEGAKSAVMVSASRVEERQNNISNYLLKMAGMPEFDARRQSVFETFYPTCFREGFVAEDVVDIQSNNNYYNGFCIHSNTHVELNSNNVFEAGTVVSMPDTGDLVLPQSGFETNEGLEAALRSGTYRLRVLRKATTAVESILNGEDTHLPDYINNTTPVELTNKKADETDLGPGNIYTYDGNNGCRLTVSPTVPIKEFVLITNCEIKFGTETELNDVLIATTDTGAKAMNSSAKLQVGLNDSCAEGGGAQLISYGGISFTADLRMYGGQLIALGDIEFSANANGIEGASMIAGGRIDGTSNMNMGFCLTGMEDNFEAAYFRLAR